MQTPTPPQLPAGSSASKSVWIAAGVLGTVIVVLLAAVLYKLSASPASPTAQPLAPTASASMPTGARPAPSGGTGAQSAVAVTNAIPSATGAAQFAPLQPSNKLPQQTGRVAQPQRQTQPVADRDQNAAPQTFAPQTFAPQPVQAPSPQAPACASCGTVVAVTPVQEPGQANGIGAVVGGVVGGLLGNQVGGGNGRTAATVIGALGGGYAGNEVQKRVNAQTVYRVDVRMDDGQTRTATLGTAPPMGQRVQFGANGGLSPLP